MPLVQFTTDKASIPVDARNVNFIKDYQQGTDVWTWTTHEGFCISEREANRYDDSDFYMTIWDDAKGKAQEVMFATTRGWSYPAMASKPDASPEIHAKYQAWKVKQDRLSSRQ